MAEVVKSVRLSDETIQRITTHMARLQALWGPAVWVNEGMALRDVILKGLDVAEGAAEQASVSETSASATADPGYDASKYVLGKLCRNSHEWQQTGQSLLYKRNRTCVECHRMARRKKG